MIMVGDRGMITSARIADLRELPGMAWITCLRGPAIKKLMADGGPLQLSLFDEQDLAEIEFPGYPAERLICCRNPFLAAERARKRQDLLAATEQDLGKIAARVAAGRIKDPAAIGLRAGKVLNKRKMPSTSPSRSPKAASAGSATPPPSTPRRSPTGSTSSAPRYRRKPSTRPASWPPTRDWSALSATSAPSKPTIWTCAHLAPARRPRQSPRADLHARLLPHPAPPQSLGAAHLHRRAPTPARELRSPRQDAQRPPKPGHPARPDPAGSASTASATSSPTWPP